MGASESNQDRKRVEGKDGLAADVARLVADYDWSEVFGEGSGGNTDGTVEAARPGSFVSLGPVYRERVAEIYATVDGENDGADWVGLFRMDDGRYLVASGGCDYTGWDCRAGNRLVVAETFAEALVYGLSQEEADRLCLGVLRDVLANGGAS